ncbi:transcriptional regulatory protein TetR family [Chondrocystis sp. NIES-4102]|nr:transcriptional regulatory protein TetR family [Chondrocystis sp. NIES-4102]
MKRTNKREQLIQVGKQIIVQQGFKAASLNEILTAAGVPKGSFYYYFPSKEDFGLAIIDDFAQKYQNEWKYLVEASEFSPLIRLRNFFESKIAEMENCQCTDGCLIGNLAQELSAQNELFRDRLNRIFSEWERYFSQCLRAASEAGEIRGEWDFDELGEFMLSSWQGTVLQAKVTKSVLPMKTFVKILFEQILT